MTTKNQYIAAIDARLVKGTNGGDSTYWTALMHGFLQTGATLPLLFVSNTPRPEKIPWSSAWRWETVSAPSNRLWSWFKFPQTAKKLGADAIHTQYNLSPLAGKCGVTTIHDVSFFIGPEWFPRRHRFLLQKFVPASAKRSAAVITVSETSRREIEQFIPAARGKTHVTLLASPPWISPMDHDSAVRQCSKDFGIEGAFVFTAGNSWARKNQSLVIQAMALLKGRSDLKLVIAGKPGSEPVGPNVQRIGFAPSESISALYSAASQFVFPSLHEGFGLPILEAFSCSCPVICGAAGAMPEVAGGAAEVLPDYQPQTWADAILRLGSGSGNLDAIKEQGRRRAAEFSWKRTAEQTLDVYHKAAL